jgi:hypothetical protein
MKAEAKQAKTKIVAFRVNPNYHEAFKTFTDNERKTFSEVMRKAMYEYFKKTNIVVPGKDNRAMLESNPLTIPPGDGNIHEAA